MMDKKADFEWSTIGRWLLVLIITVVIVILIYLFRGKIVELVDNIVSALSFGG
jgi:4-hydroxybenzoate polyprenyltransferase